jgi:hypothetical protein
MMENRSAIAVLVSLLVASVGASPVAALTSKECSAKYRAAKSAGTLAGKSWNDFRKTECAANGPAATTEPATKPAAPTEPAKTTEPAKDAAPTKPAATTAAAPSSAVFPTAVSSKYSSEKPGTARRHACLDQYNANKAKNANGGLKWIVKGGGYYSECNKRLKG